ncbi:uncharacterized protein LOC135501725 [Lineus longissimus]|uniref:uncharacterized protein LOC135501725 n=1 Tax=Lineus longissimus TaxID=88925 RepID=UPI00315D137F
MRTRSSSHEDENSVHNDVLDGPKSNSIARVKNWRSGVPEKQDLRQQAQPTPEELHLGEETRIGSGSAKAWPKFIERFHDQVHQKPRLTYTRRMDILQSHLAGDAQKLVQGIGFSGKCYAEALLELKLTLGHRNKVARAYLDAVTRGPLVPAHSVQALRDFFVNVRDAIITLTKLNQTMDLLGSDILMRAARRLPNNKITQWNRFVGGISKSREPTIHDFRDWLQDSLIMDSNPYAIPYDRKEEKPNDKSVERSEKQSTVWNVVANGGQDSRSSDTYGDRTRNGGNGSRKSDDSRSRKSPSCGLCHEDHALYKCSKFIAKDITARHELVKTLKLCYNCLKPHQVKMCPSTSRCRQDACGRKHHSLLHDNKPQLQENRVSKDMYHTQANQGTFFQLVEIYATGNNGGTVRTVAVLDSGSQITLIHKSLAEGLGLKGERRQLLCKQ